MTAATGSVEMLKYLIKDKRVDVLAADINKDDALTIAIKQKNLKVASALVDTRRFPIAKVNERTRLNYFCYAVTKGCKDLALKMLNQVKETHGE